MKKISRLISVIHRHGMRFFDWSLADTEIGPGQQFFLVCIYENPGSACRNWPRSDTSIKALLQKR